MDRVPAALDAVVIGSGVGGLTAAALLAKAGKRVLVLEQHEQAGGCTHTFENKGFEFDVGKPMNSFSNIVCCTKPRYLEDLCDSSNTSINQKSLHLQ